MVINHLLSGMILQVPKNILGGAFKHVVFFREMIQFDEYFPMGWNRQLVLYGDMQ